MYIFKSKNTYWVTNFMYWVRILLQVYNYLPWHMNELVDLFNFFLDFFRFGLTNLKTLWTFKTYFSGVRWRARLVDARVAVSFSKTFRFALRARAWPASFKYWIESDVNIFVFRCLVFICYFQLKRFILKVKVL